MTRNRFTFALLLAVALASPALAQPAQPTATWLPVEVIDRDDSGTTTCGDLLVFRLGIDGAFGIDLRRAHLELPLNPQLALDPTSLVISSPNPVIGPVDILSGDQTGDSVISLDLGQICVTGSCPNLRPETTITFTTEISRPNPFTLTRIQGELSGSNFAPILTDDPGQPGASDPVVVPYEGCAQLPPGGLVITATQADSLVTDHDGDGLVDPGDRVRYTAVASTNGLGTGNLTVFTSGIDPASRLAVGSVTTSQGAVLEGNGSGHTRARVSIGTLTANPVTIRFDVVVNDPVPAAVSQLSSQGNLTGQNFPLLVTDDPDTPATSDPTITALDFDPDLALAKDDGGVSTTPGALLPYTLRVTNLTAQQAATGVVLTETVPALTTFDALGSSPGWACTPNPNAGSTCRLTVGTVAGSATVARTFALRVANPVPAGSTAISNTASVAGDASQGPDPDLTNNTASDSTPFDPATTRPDLTLAKTDGGLTAEPGDTVVYTLTYANAGNRGATRVTLTETVPVLSRFAPALSSPGWSCLPSPAAGSTCTLDVGLLPGGGAGGTAQFAVLLDATVPAGTTETTNRASIADDGANGADANPADNAAQDTTPIEAEPHLELLKTLDSGSDPTPGGVLVWRISYANVGNEGAADVVLHDEVPEHTTFSPPASSPGWACTPGPGAGGQCTLLLGTVPAGASGEVLFAARLDATLPAGLNDLQNCVTTNPGPEEGLGATACITIGIPGAVPDLAITKDDGAVSIRPGEVVVYTLRFANYGTQGASGVFLRESVPSHTTFEPGASTAGWSCVPGPQQGSVCRLVHGGLDAGATGFATFAVRLVASPPPGVLQVVNTVSVDDDGENGDDADPANNFATDTTPIAGVEPGPEPQLTATLDDLLTGDTNGDGVANPGEQVTYVATLENSGDGSALDAVFHAPIDPHSVMVPDSVTTTHGTVELGNDEGDTYVQVDLGDLPAQELVTITFTVVVEHPFPETLDQIACQGQLMGTNFPLLPTDDPETGEPDDPTVTPVLGLADGDSILEVPTLGSFGLVFLAGLLAASAFARLRRSRRAS